MIKAKSFDPDDDFDDELDDFEDDLEDDDDDKKKFESRSVSIPSGAFFELFDLTHACSLSIYSKEGSVVVELDYAPDHDKKIRGRGVSFNDAASACLLNLESAIHCKKIVDPRLDLETIKNACERYWQAFEND